MENKIQQLTEQLYNEGVAKGKQESDQIIASANAEAAKILANAKKDAAHIIEKAEADAVDLSTKTLSDVKRSSAEMLMDVKSQLEKAVVAKIVSADVKSAFADDKFIKELILSSVNAWGAKSSEPIMVNVAAKTAESVADFVKSKVDAASAQKITIGVSSSVKNGFTISPKGEGYYISFTEDDFNALISDYMRAKVAQILFGK
ncbi:MAG: hypothetical protein RR141_00825 [Rikenellaceae bacterium]